MENFKTENIRNIALIGHSGEGKTSLAEAMMYTAGSIERFGKVDDGNAHLDYDDEEIKRKISINLSIGYAIHKGTKINIIDTPGFFDFEGEVYSALTVAGSAIVVTSASGSMSVGTDKSLSLCKKRNLPVVVFVNGIDKENADYFNTVDDIMLKYKNTVPVELPIIKNGEMIGYYNIIADKGYANDDKTEIEVPNELKEMSKKYRTKITECVAETTEEMMEKYFAGEAFTNEELDFGMRKSIIAKTLKPIFVGSALKLISINRLLDRIVDILPPASMKTPPVITVEGDEIPCVATNPFVGHVFKSVVDPYVGNLLIFKVLSGKIKSGDTVINASKNNATEKVGTLYILKGKKQEVVDELMAGDIGALAKLTHTKLNDTLCDQKHPVLIPPITFPKPVISYAVSATKDEEKGIQMLIKMQEEDPTFKVEKNNDTGQVLISGLGETQLDIMCNRVKKKSNIAIQYELPKVAYRETIRKEVSAEGKHKKQSGGAGQYGVVQIKFEPGAADGEFEFIDKIVGGAVSKPFVAATEKGLREAIKKGVLAGYPMINIKATLFDGKEHPVDSKEVAFISAAKLAYQEACVKASPCFLEPIMEAKITVPDDFLGTILGDINKRRGRILGTQSLNGKQEIIIEVPHAEMFRYATDLRSMTQGRGSFEMHFVRYEEVPQNLNDKIIKESKEV